ncbi:Uncharacterised protein [uncultured Eubacterium sp.]|nr:Uncharacterised protein [uncultured Eubacterium sp.]
MANYNIKNKWKETKIMKLNKYAVEMLRARRCITTNQLANNAKVSAVTIRRGYENNIDAVCVGKFAKALNINVEDIIQE